MRVEILTEDSSGALVVKRLVTLMMEEMNTKADIYVRPHRGCGNLPKDLMEKPAKMANSLLALLPAELRAYNKFLVPDNDLLIVVMDSDDNDPTSLRNQLYDLSRMFAPDVRTVVGLCTEEIEAWLLGDENAIMTAYPEANMDALLTYKQDSICGTWEKLCEVVCPENFKELIEIGYPAIGSYKAKWAENISKYMNPDYNVSPSFMNFYNALKLAASNPMAIKKPRVRRLSF